MVSIMTEKNNFKILGETTEIYFQQHDGNFKTLIDTEDLELVFSLNLKWFAGFNKNANARYVTTSKTINKKKTTIPLHRLVMGSPKNMIIDHINGNTLDNRKSNLRVVTKGQNSQNLKNERKNSVSGVRGVNWHKTNKRWTANVRINGKRIYLGSYKAIEEAKKVVIEYRKKNMEFSSREVI